MKDAMLYAFAALGLVTLARWVVPKVAVAVMNRTGLTRRLRRLVLRRTFETIGSPDWQARLIREVSEVSDDLRAALHDG